MELTLQFTERYEQKIDEITAVQPEFRDTLITELEASGQQAIQEAHQQVEQAKRQQQSQTPATSDTPDDTGE